MKILKDTGAMLEGHFLLSSGRHSDKYFQCARFFMNPEEAEEAMIETVFSIRRDFDVVVGPAMGGVIPSWIIGRLLGIQSMFVERDDDGKMTLRRGFELEGKTVLIAEDVLTTGKSSRECADAIEKFGGKVKSLFCVVDRRPDDVKVEWPVYSMFKVDAHSWLAEDCPLCKQGIPAVKPGSRKIF